MTEIDPTFIYRRLPDLEYDSLLKIFGMCLRHELQLDPDILDEITVAIDSGESLKLNVIDLDASTNSRVLSFTKELL